MQYMDLQYVDTYFLALYKSRSSLTVNDVLKLYSLDVEYILIHVTVLDTCYFKVSCSYL